MYKCTALVGNSQRLAGLTILGTCMSSTEMWFETFDVCIHHLEPKNVGNHCNLRSLKLPLFVSEGEEEKKHVTAVF